MMLGPVLVTVLAPRTAKLPADPRSIGASAAGACAMRFVAVKQRATAAATRNALTLFVGFTDPHFTSLCSLLFFMIKDPFFSVLFARIWFLLSIGVRE